MADRVINRWARFCLSYRKSVLAVVVAITALTGGSLGGLRFDNALEVWFLDDDPFLMSHQRLIDTYGSDELIVIGMDTPDALSAETLAIVDRVTREVAEAPHVEKVFSLTDIEAMTGEDDALRVGKLVEFPLSPEGLRDARARAFGSELYVGNVISASGDFTCIIARLPHIADSFDYKIEAVEGIRAILDRERKRSGVHFYVSGGPPLDEQFFVLSEQDSTRTLVLMSVLLVVVLWLLLRSAVGVLVPLTTVGLATTWAIGSMVLFDVRVNLVTTILPPLLLAVGVADSMHFLVDYQNRCARGVGKIEALYQVYAELGVPLFLTSLTTAIGMLSLSISKVAGIREFGLFAALGVASAFLLSVTFVPIALSYVPVPKPRRGRFASRLVTEGSLQRLHTFTMRRGRPIVAVSSVLIALGVAGAMQIRAESLFLEQFPKGHVIRSDTRYIEQKLAGAMTIEFLVDTGREDGIKDPAVLRKLEELQTFVESQPNVRSSQSITDYFKELRRAMFGGDQREYKLPETREEAAQYLILYELDAPDGDIKEYVSFDYREARVSARVDLTSSNDALAVVQSSKAWVRSNFPPDVHTTITGLMMLYTNMEEYIRTSVTRGFTIALIAIFIIMCVQMRSIGLGLIAMIPNVAPIIIGLGVMGATGIRLDSTTAMVASIAIGLAVDDSIHFVSRVRMHLSQRRSMVDSLRRTTVEIGRAIVYTSLVLCGGFSVMLVGSFVGMVYFGLLCMVTIVVALIADLLLLPVVLRWYDGHTKAAIAVETPVPAGAQES